MMVIIYDAWVSGRYAVGRNIFRPYRYVGSGR